MIRMEQRFSFSRMRVRAGVRARACAVAMAFVCALYPVSYTAAQGSATPTMGFKHGKVMARQLVLGVNGKPIFAEFDTAGEVVSELGEATEQNKLQGALVIPGATVRGMVAAFDDLRQRYPDAVVMTRTQYEASRFGLSKDNLLDRPALTSQVKSVLVRVSRIISDVTLVPDQSFVLDTYPLLLPLSGVGSEQVTDQTVAVLINNDGVVQRASPHNIGFRAAWISDTTSDVSRDNLATRQIDQKPLGPVTGVLVYGGLYGTMSLTDANGGYSIQYMIPGCPGGSYSIGNKVIAELRTQNFNPRGTYVSSYTVQAPFEDHCYGSYAGLAAGPVLGAQSAYSDSQAIMATNSMVEPPLDIKIDVMSLAGQGVLSNDGTLNNAIPVAGETAYATAAVTFNPFNPTFLDLNSDGRADQTFLCGENVKVYFDAPPAEQDPCLAQADVTRLADRPADFTDQGLLKSITETDLEQTDLYVFRVSNGSLISERKGLKPPTTTYQSSGISKNPDGSASNQFFYNMLLRGPRDLGSANPMNTLSFTDWQTASGIKDPALLERKADHLRVGEQIKIIAINRVTGYIGSVTTTLQNAAGNQSGALRIGADKIVLRPPNLKIKAERTSIVEAGLTKGEEREYLIGFEGSALKSDKVIALSTEWVDADGSPLPDGLPGYTGRLAKVVDGRRLGGLPPRNDLAEFEVKPGKRVQLIALPDDVAVSNDHFYVHVCAARYSDRTECAAHYTQNRQLSASNPLHYRPKHYVPVRVPLYDEALTQLTKLQLRDNLNNAANDESRQKWLAALRNFDPNYRWPYRPEMQFSVFDLTLRDITKNDITGATTSLLSSNDATLSADNQLQVSYDLIGQTFESLPRIGPARELVFNLSGAEATATLGVNQQVRFDDLRFLDKLAPEDFITLALLQNDDVANVLWEYVIPKVLLWADYNRNGEIDTDHSDDTAPDKPFIFWVNDDADMVLDQGQIRDDRVECPSETAHATCEEDDVNNLRSSDDGYMQVSNTDDEHKKRIESMRDLEDFIPMQASYWPYVESATMELKAVGVEVNVFRATWEKPRDDVENEAAARRDAENSKDDYLFQLKDGQSAPIPEQYVQQLPAPGGLDVTMGQVNLLVEGTAASADTCVNPATSCYLELIIRDGQGHFTNSYKLYLHFKPITRLFEHWTLGDCEGQISGCTLQSQLARAADQTFDYSHEPGLAWLGRKEYFLYVHGWRMQPSERRLFARTTFKRLYWQGYKGRFGALTWPTTYFTKPGWWAEPLQFAAALANPQNYDRGEVIARRTGAVLAQQWASFKRDSTPINVLAHSQGNVLVSEALRHYPSAGMMRTYVLTQPAEAAHAYTPSAPDYPNWLTRAGGSGTAFYNGSELIENWPDAIAADPLYYLAIPPDRYRYNVGSEHWLEPSLEIPPAPHYYNGIFGKAVNIVNFYNAQDVAMDAWRQTQRFKMDSGTAYKRYMTVDDPDATLDAFKQTTVRDEFFSDGTLRVWEGDGKPEILAMITPARSWAAGEQGGMAKTNPDVKLPATSETTAPPLVTAPAVSEVKDDMNMQEHKIRFTDGSYDHSGEFLSNNALRWCYWNQLAFRLGIIGAGDEKCE